MEYMDEDIEPDNTEVYDKSLLFKYLKSCRYDIISRIKSFLEAEFVKKVGISNDIKK